VNTVLPLFTFTKVGTSWVATATPGAWLGAPTTYSYVWQRCKPTVVLCGSIPGATSATYTLRQADMGYRIRLLVTARNSVGSASATSSLSVVLSAAALS
jgi:hypothetical protein